MTIACIGIDGESTAVVVLQRVRDRIGCCITVSCKARDVDDRSIGGIFDDRVCGSIGIGNGPDIEFVDIANVDGERLSCR